MKILGIHDGHNASACLLDEGIIKIVLQEERLRREKNYFGFPERAIETILFETGTDISDIDYVAMNGKHMPPFFGEREDKMKTYRELATPKGTLRATTVQSLKKTPLYNMYIKKRKWERLKCLRKMGILEEKIVFVEHHEAHASAAYFGFPWWKKEKVLVITCDGAGDGICATINIGENGNLRRIVSIPEKESIAWYYGMLTFVMGMIPNEHEYKIMGLAPYAPQKSREIAFERFNNLMEFKGGTLEWKRKRGIPPAAYSYHFIRELTELLRFDWIAAGIQMWVEKFASEWVRSAIKRTGIRKVALSGGLFMNVKVNKAISEIPELEDIFIFPSCGDESNSIGAAYALYAEKCKELGMDINIEPLGPIYFGTDIKNSEVEQMLSHMKGSSIEYYTDMDKEIGKLLADGKIVARCRGRMEFGARALGNRSILADPSNMEVIRIINNMIKNRDFWMPFAPTILKERESDYIIKHKDVHSPYMMMTFDSNKGNYRDMIAALHQEDLTTRPQILEKDCNIGYYKVIKEFERRTGRGVILNTSFNLHGYPIVRSVEDALWVFENSGLEYLAIGDYLVYKDKYLR
ncbi:MAG: carbamoyltransferase C-terminal domain-containing protein [Halobacteriota archaeon]